MQDIVQWDYGSWPDGLPKKDGANALSGAGSLDTATTRLSKTSRTKNLIIEYLKADMATCPLCQRGVLRLIAVITQGAVIGKILRHLKRSADPPPITPARSHQTPCDWVA